MSGCYLDSNFLIYFKDKASKQHQSVVTKLNQLINTDTELYISPLVLDEFIHSTYFLLKEKIVSDRLKTLKSMTKDILEIPDLKIIGVPIEKSEQLKVLNFMKKFQLKPRDAYHLLTMISNSVSNFATFDTDFKKVFSSKLLLPV